MPKTYLDYAATTPLNPKVLRQMMPYLRKNFGNPSSIHSLGQKALRAIEESRQKVAKFLNCSEKEVIFTGSATEANNMAILGLVQSGHIITTRIEHHAILEPLKELEKRGVQVTYLSVDKDGLVILDELKRAIRKDTVLVSIMYANNEIGVVQPIAELAKIVKEINEKIYFHTDAVQAVNYLDCDVKKLGVDLLTLSSHKIYGPKGVGALFIKKGTPLKPLIAGGGQEFDLRSGTENVAGIVGLGAAIEEVENPRTKLQNIKIRHLRDKLIKATLKSIPDAQLNGSAICRLPNNANFTFKGAEGEALVIALDQKGLEVSTGSACSSKVLEASHVLLALGLSEEAAHGSLRITLGKDTEEKDIEKFLRVLPQVLGKLRKFSGYKV
jgi:cysteine desulfurase